MSQEIIQMETQTHTYVQFDRLVCWSRKNVYDFRMMKTIFALRMAYQNSYV